MTMYLEAGRLFLGAQGRLDVQPVFGGLRKEGPYWYLRFMPNSWDVKGNPTAVWKRQSGRLAYCEVKLCNAEVKLQICLMNCGTNRQDAKFKAFQNAAAPLACVTDAGGKPVNTDAFPKFWQTTILTHKGKARSDLKQLNWPDADIDQYLGAQIAFKLSEILKSDAFAAASAQVVATLRKPAVAPTATRASAPLAKPPTQP